MTNSNSIKTLSLANYHVNGKKEPYNYTIYGLNKHGWLNIKDVKDFINKAINAYDNGRFTPALSEQRTDIFKFFIDLDFHKDEYDIDVSNNDVLDIVNKCKEIILKHGTVNVTYTVAKNEKGNYHIVFPFIFVDKHTYGNLIKKFSLNFSYKHNVFDPCASLRSIYTCKNGEYDMYKPYNLETQEYISEFDIENYTIRYIGDANLVIKNDIKFNNKQQITEKPFKLSNKDIIHILVDNLSIKRASEYKMWLNVVFCLKSLSNDEDYKDLAHYFSQKAENYDSDALNNKWETALKSQFTIGSLHHWCKEDIGKEAYQSLIKKHQTLMDYNNLFDGEEGLARIFVKYKHNDIRITDNKNNSGYVWNEEIKLWKFVNKQDISNMVCPLIVNIGSKIIRGLEKKLDNKDLEDKHKEYIKNKIGEAKYVIKLIKTATKRKNVFYIVASQLRNENFESELNNKSRVLIPLKDIYVLDFSDDKMIIRERTRKDYFSRTFNVTIPNEIIDGEVTITETGYYDIINNFMLQIMNNDQESLKYFQKVLGYSITAQTSDRSFGI